MKSEKINRDEVADIIRELAAELPDEEAPGMYYADDGPYCIVGRIVDRLTPELRPVLRGMNDVELDSHRVTPRSAKLWDAMAEHYDDASLGLLTNAQEHNDMSVAWGDIPEHVL